MTDNTPASGVSEINSVLEIGFRMGLSRAVEAVRAERRYARQKAAEETPPSGVYAHFYAIEQLLLDTLEQSRVRSGEESVSGTPRLKPGVSTAGRT